jgi:hypothetical protein
MRLIMKSKDAFCNIKVDAIEKVEDVVFAYKKPHGSIAATEFVGCFDLGSADFLYVTDEKTNETRG